MDIKNLINTLHPLERKVLQALKDNTSLDYVKKATSLSEVEIIRALQWLENKDIIKKEQEIQEIISLDKNGQIYLSKGLPEKNFLKALTKSLTLQQIKQKTNLTDEELNISLGILRKKSLISIKKDKTLIIFITDQGKKFLQKETLEEQFLKKLPLQKASLKEEEKYAYNELKTRKQIIKTETKKILKISLTNLAKEILKQKLNSQNLIETLTPQIIKDSLWKTKSFRAYDVKINVPKIYPGKRHFVNQAIDDIKRIWLDLGFKEMEGPLIAESFWNFDALFTPQDHPARDLQDTFFIKDLKASLQDKELVKRVKLTHENGYNTNSKGWQYKWNEEKAKDLVLRTHTTVLSAKTIAKLKKADLPVKYFSVGEVFRNETIDWKHSFEFYQVEGIVIDENANFKHLLGYLKEYYKKLGFEKIKFRPAYFPYTEPSCEIIAFHPEKKEWIELGGSGIFRPEVVKPLLGFEVPVLAWGQGLERGIMDYYEINDLRKIYSNDLKLMRKMKIWR